MADRARSVSPKQGAKTLSAKAPRSGQKAAAPRSVSRGNSKSPMRSGSSKSPERKATSSRGRSRQKSRSPQRPSTQPNPRSRSARSTDSKRSNKSDKAAAMDAPVSKGCSSITGKRVLAIKVEIEKKGLQTTDMSGQGLTFVPLSAFNRKEIGVCDFSSNNIRALPPDIKKLTTLVHLDISKNGIRCMHPNDNAGIPNEISLLPSLEVIIISECNLPFIPPSIWKCKNLKVLDISRNKINILVPEVGNLEQLRHLNAQQTNIATLPPEIAFCQELEELLLWGNAIESLPETMREMPKLQAMTINYRSFCTMVDNYMDNLLKKGQIQSEHIPPVIFEMQGLTELDLGDTKINTLPEKCLGQLNELYLHKNYFLKLPEMVLNAESLQILDISENIMLSLPDEITRLRNLRVFRAGDNKFREITPAIGVMTQLEELALCGNELELLPDSIGKLTKLKTLLLDRNKLKAIPDSIVNLTELETLDLTANQLTALPVNFYKMTGLKMAHTYQKIHKHGLWLHKNPLTVPPQYIWKTERPEKIYTYMKKLQIMKTENLNRQKLILLGESQSGKTSLMNTLFGGKSHLTKPYTDSTPMVDFQTWKTENKVDFLIFDLGGHEVYKNTHHLFLDQQALYLLVYDHRKYTPQNHHEAIGCWLDMLYMLTPGAVVQLVGTQCDQCYPDIVETVNDQVKEQLTLQMQGYSDKINEEIRKVKLRLSDPESRLSVIEMQLLKEQMFRLMQLSKTPLRVTGDISLVSCAEGIHGIPELIQNIEIMAVDKELFPNGQKRIPEEWEKFRMSLKRLKVYCLTMNEVHKQAAPYNLDVKDCLSYFRDIGDILWYDNIPQMKDMVFYRPRSLVFTLQGLFHHNMDKYLNFQDNRVFSSKGGFDLKLFEIAKERFDCSGEISRDLLLCLWFYQKVKYEEFPFLVDLVQRLDLCFAIPQAEIPLHRYDFQPLIVAPIFNKDAQPEDISPFWPDEMPPNFKELEISQTFPIFYPRGLFEKVACRIQPQVEYRTDWHDLIHAEMENGVKLLLARTLDSETYDFVLSVKVRSHDLEMVKEVLGCVHGHFASLLINYPGLVWYTKLNKTNCGDLTISDCFPQSVITSVSAQPNA